jgi:hypothetical protein
MRAAFWDGPKTGIPTEVDEINQIYRLWVGLAFAKVRFDAIYERLFRARDHEIYLIKIRVKENGRNVFTGRTSFSVANLTRAGKSAVLRSTLNTFRS